jgi:outer membrane lipoprotein LolB
MYQQNDLRAISRRMGYVFLFLSALFLSACANQQTRTDTDRRVLWESHRQKMAGINHWEFSGRMAVRLEEEAWSASLLWTQVGDEFEIRIIAPLAQGTALITGNGDKVSLKTSDNQEFTDSDVMQIMKQNLGWSIPVNDLTYWIRGITRSGSTNNGQVIDNDGRLVSIQQDNWLVTYQRYDLSTEYALPSRIELTGSGARIRVVINRWDINPS